uniref:Uncharacterized protein n=1 Tax=Musca domestica TaxID=7370 RepID=A0A1I8MMT5_MUSDO
MNSALTSLKEKCTARHLAIFLGLLCTILIVVVVVLSVETSNLSHDLKEARQKLEILELYIQNMATTSTSTEATSTTTFSVPQPPIQTTTTAAPETAPPPPVLP